MRKALIGMVLAASVSIPTVAWAQEAEEARTPRQQRAVERYERLEQRNQQRYEQRQQRQEARQQDQGAQQRQGWDGQRAQRSERRQERIENRQEQAQDRRGGWRNQPSGSGEWVGDPNDPRMERHRQRYERLEQQNRRDWAREQRQDRREARDDRRDWRQDRRADRRWDRQWRNDRRYDWYSYRNRYRDVYRVGRYYDPFGYGYRRFSIGIRIGQPFYAQRYWINDPWHYRLPDAGPGFRWVRYYNDVLLVDTWSGEVVDVIYDFFW